MKNFWEQLPHPGHLCVGKMCQFRLATIVGAFLVSTVGEYFPKGQKEMEMIGGYIDGDSFKPFYETMVFRCGAERHDCGCPSNVDYSEIECLRCETDKEALKQHRELCEKYSRLYINDDHEPMHDK